MLTEKILRLMAIVEDWFFCRFGSLDFDGIILKENLGVDEACQSFDHVTAFQSVWCRNLRSTFKLVKHMFPEKFEYFVDIGSGKGKPCFYAEKSGVARKYIGIELSPLLVDISNKNKSKFRTSTVEFMEADATSYKLPNSTCLLFLFNPFSGDVLREFCDNNNNKFQTDLTVVVYVNDKQRSILSEYFDEMYRDSERQLSIHVSRRQHCAD